jgi:DNA topology modulation protein flaR-related protein
MKIYIIGPPASGKTTLSKMLSKRYNIKSYELDCIVWDDNNHIMRDDKTIKRMFNDILVRDSFIIEDVGRSIFREGLKKCDKIYYIKMNKLEAYKRVIKRLINQKLGKEAYNYPPSFRALIDMIKVVNSYYKREKKKLDYINKFKEKVIYLDKDKLNNLENR